MILLIFLALNPYSSIVLTGPDAGKLHCYVCENVNRDVCCVLARDFSPQLEELAVQHDKDKSRVCWITFLRTDTVDFKPKALAWAKKLNLRKVILTIYESNDPPPGYELPMNVFYKVYYQDKRDKNE